MYNILVFLAPVLLVYTVVDVLRRVRRLPSGTPFQKGFDALCALFELLICFLLAQYVMASLAFVGLYLGAGGQFLAWIGSVPSIIPLVLVFGIVYLFTRQSVVTYPQPGTEKRSKGGMGELVAVIGVSILYISVAALGVMATDSCGVSCPIMPWLQAGWIWLALSLFGFMYALSQGVSEKKWWLVIFYPFIAVPIFIGLVALGMSIQ